MIAIDTNIIVRYVTRDDAVQEKQAQRFFENHPVYVSIPVLMETEWVLRRIYKLDRATIHRTFTVLLGAGSVTVEQPQVVMAALAAFRVGFDFADAIHLAGCPVRQFATFDSDLRKRATTAFATPEVMIPKDTP